MTTATGTNFFLASYLFLCKIWTFCIHSVSLKFLTKVLEKTSPKSARINNMPADRSLSGSDSFIMHHDMLESEQSTATLSFSWEGTLLLLLLVLLWWRLCYHWGVSSRGCFERHGRKWEIINWSRSKCYRECTTRKIDRMVSWMHLTFIDINGLTWYWERQSCVGFLLTHFPFLLFLRP